MGRHWSDRALWSYISTLANLMSCKVGLALGLMVSLSLIEGVGLLMLVPLLRLVGLETGQGELDAIDGFVSSIFSAVGIRPTLITVLIVCVLIVSLWGLLQRLQVNTSSSLHHEFVAVLRQRLYRSIASTNWLFFVRSRPSEFTHVLTSEMDRVGAATYHLLRLFATAIVGAVYLVFSLGLSPLMTGVVVVCAGGLGLILKGKLRISRETGKEVSQAMRGLYAAIAAHLGGMKVVRSYGAEDRHVEAFERLTRQTYQMHLHAIQNQTAVRHWFEMCSVVALSTILFVSLEVLAMPTAQALLLLFLFARLMPRFSEMVQSYHHFIHLLPGFTAVMEMQKRCDSAAELPPQIVKRLEFRHAIRLEGISFGYDGVEVIHDFDMILRFGETVALVGPSGAGKTTVADIIMGLLVPDKGRVLVDGVPLGPDTVKSWRDQVGYVSQDTFLFHDTVRANLLFARPDATDEDIHRALVLAAADEFVSSLPKGIDTVVGDRGMRLSGGQRQRLALAMALIRKSSLLILDEATSFLDSENERCILETIDQLRGKMTVLIISHRLSARRGADTIYALEDRQVTDSGVWNS